MSSKTFYFWMAAFLFLAIKYIHGLYLNSQPGYLDGHVIQTLESPRAIICGKSCVLRDNCASFNFYSQRSLCELNDATKDEYPGLFVYLTGGKQSITYHDRQENIYQNISNPCLNNACQHGSYCIPDYNNSVSNVNCRCKNRWTGMYCEVEVVPIWSDWSMWSDGCSATCGTAVQVRHRVCENGRKDRGNCEGNRKEVQRCYGENRTCPEWSMWSDVGSCSTSCGQGIVTRTRQCMHGWSSCDGPVEETVRCRRPSCEVPWRLADGSRIGEGRLEVYNDITARWGTVNSDGWQHVDTDVACRTLGFVTLDGLCEDGWTLYDRRCYKFVGEKKTFTDAHRYCKNDEQRTRQVSVTTIEEDHFVRNSFVNEDTWLGGLNVQPDGTYRETLRWFNGDAFSYSSDLSDVVPADSKVCLYMDQGGSWHLENDCSREKPFVCEKVASSFTHEFSPGSGDIHRINCMGSESHLNQCSLIGWRNRTLQASASHSKDVGLKCGVNGRWSVWSAWTNCPDPCVPDDRRSRDRQCTNPAPVLDGLPCVGDSYEEEPCLCTP